MIKVENFGVYNFENAVRGMRNPLNSWKKNDSVFGKLEGNFALGENDIGLLKRLIKSGNEHRKVLRQIFVSVDITAPLYWWKEMDQYKIGTTTNSCSTMHTIYKKEFELDDFSHEHLCEGALIILEKLVYSLNTFREAYLDTSNKEHWWQLIQLLPSSYNQKRTWTGSYENLVNMYHQRKNHKLDEWHKFCEWIESLPYMNIFLEASNGQDKET